MVETPHGVDLHSFPRTSRSEVRLGKAVSAGQGKIRSVRLWDFFLASSHRGRAEMSKGGPWVEKESSGQSSTSGRA